MGTDIHLYVEKRNPYYAEEGGPEWVLMMHEDATYDSRSYNVFAVLANVRNGFGVAGCRTGAGFRPISPPRGLPKDMSPEMYRAAENVEHTPSWLTLKEILDYDWKQVSTHYGWVGPTEFIRWQREGKPSSWSGDIGGGSVRKVSNAEMAAAIADSGGAPTTLDEASLFKDRLSDERPQLSDLYTQVEWSQTYEQACAGFLEWCRALVMDGGYKTVIEYVEEADGRITKKEVKKYVESGPFHYDAELIRFVFWFDS